MVEVLTRFFPDAIVDNIAAYAATEEIEWETVYGFTMIYKTKHIITYGGGPEGGYVYFYKEREPGWYAWERDWLTTPTYKKLDGQIAIWWGDGTEKIGVLHRDYEPSEDDDITIMRAELMEMEED